MPYNLKYCPDSLILGTGNRIIVTGWTVPERVAKKLEKSDYAVVGPLYNPNYGLNYLLANLLANPSYRNLYLLSATNQDKVQPAVDALYFFITNGVVEGESWLIKHGRNDNTLGKILKIFPLEVLQRLREDTKVILFSNLDGLVEAVYEEPKNISPHFNPKTSPIYIDVPIIESDTIPAIQSGQVVRGKTVVDVWVEILYRIRKNGKLPQGSKRQEIINLTSIITDEPTELYIPDWLPFLREDIEKYIPYVTERSEAQDVSYTYGNRIRSYDAPSYYNIDQLAHAVLKLKQDINSTQVFMSLWKVEEDKSSKSPPCLVSIWARVIEKRLTLVVTFRSHDMYTAYVSNLMAINRLRTDMIALYNKDLGDDSSDCIRAGEIICNSLSAHIYEWSFQDADSIIEKQYKYKSLLDDPVGNFVIETKEEEIVISHYSPLGEMIKVYNYTLTTSPLKVCRELVFNNPTIQAEHAAYLGIELSKAIQPNYKQDQ